MTAIILDTETTGVDEPDVIQLAAIPVLGSDITQNGVWTIRPGPTNFAWWKPRKPISLGAMATHHIIDDDLKGFQEWPGTWPLPPGTEYLIGHNIDFDWKAIGSPPVKRICTLALSRKLWPNLDSHSLSAMTYHLRPKREAQEALRGVHDATRDVVLCWGLLIAELGMMPAIASFERLWAASEKARIPTHFTFGKYGPQPGAPGIAIAEVRRMDPSYIDWCLTKCDQCQDEYWQRALRGQV